MTKEEYIQQNVDRKVKKTAICRKKPAEDGKMMKEDEENGKMTEED